MGLTAVKSPRKSRAKKPTPTTLDHIIKLPPNYVLSPAMAAAETTFKKKTKGGGASRRGSHALKDATNPCDVARYYSQHLRLRKISGDNYYMDFGTLVHTGLAYYYAEKLEVKPQWFIESPSVEAAMENDSLGHSEWLTKAQGIMEAFKHWEVGQPWQPILVEEEVAVSLGEIDPEGRDEPAFEVEYVDEHGLPQVYKFPTLNEEKVTCRPDLIVKSNGGLLICDHKTAGAARDKSGRLKILQPDDEYERKYQWQGMVNLTICRAKWPEIEGFVFQRIKRDIPYDFARDDFNVPPLLYDRVPMTMRASVRREREQKARFLTTTDPKRDLIAAPWMCIADGYRCSFDRLCHADGLDERKVRRQSEFYIEERELLEEG